MASFSSNSSNNYGYSVGQSSGSSQSTNVSDSQNQGTSSSDSYGQSVSGPDPGLMARWDAGYKDHMDTHSKLWDQYIAGYSDVLGRTQQQANNVQQGYNALGNQVLGTIQGIDQSRRQDINDQYQQQVGHAGQQLTSRGLGNTTVVPAVQRGLMYDKQKALNALTNQTQGMNAQYQYQAGQGGLGAQQQQLGQLASLGNSYMSGLSNYQIQALGWAPNRTDSMNTSHSQSQNTGSSHSQGQSSGSNQSQNYGENMGQNYGYSMQSNPPQYSSPSYYPQTSYPQSGIGTGTSFNNPYIGGSSSTSTTNNYIADPYGSDMYDEAGTGVVPPGGDQLGVPPPYTVGPNGVTGGWTGDGSGWPGSTQTQAKQGPQWGGYR